MNFINCKQKNFLFTSSTGDDIIYEFIKIVVELIKKGKIVLLFTREHFKFMPLLAELTKEQMCNFILSFHSDINSVIAKLLELHDWTILPDVIILNLNSYFHVGNVDPPFKQICFCISALFSYMRSVEKQRDARNFDVATSVSLLNGHRDVQIQVLVDFYFYNKSAFSEINAIKENLC